MTDDEYYTIRSSGDAGGGRRRPAGALVVAAAFAAVALAVTVVAVPMLGDRLERTQLASRPLDLDPVVTGSIRTPGEGTLRSGGDLGRASDRGGTYVVRRSVLSGSSVCVLRANGSREGSC